MKDVLGSYWLDRAPRERWVFGIGAAVLAAGIAYAYVWLPVARERERLVMDLPRLRMQAQEMRAEALLIERLRSGAGAASPDLKAALASVTARQEWSRMTPQVTAEANGRMRVSFASVAAKDWQAWIAALSAERAIRIEAVQIDALDTRGTITASTILSAGK